MPDPTPTIFAKPPKPPKAIAPKLAPDRRALLVARIAERSVARWVVMPIPGASATASAAMKAKFREIAEDAVTQMERCYGGEEFDE